MDKATKATRFENSQHPGMLVTDDGHHCSKRAQVQVHHTGPVATPPAIPPATAIFKLKASMAGPQVDSNAVVVAQ